MKNRGIASLFLIGALTTGLFVGCGSATKATSTKSDEKILNIWTNMEVETDALQKLGDVWGKDHGYKVNVKHQSPSVQQMAQAVNSKDAPDAVVGIPNDQLADYMNAGLTQEVPKDIYQDADFSPAAVQACYSEGKRYALPIAVETISLFVNIDLVKEIPSSWEELVKSAKTVGGVQFDASSIYYDLGFVRACGGYIFKYNNGKYDVKDIGLDKEGAVRAYSFINSLHKDYGYVSQDITADIARSNFQNGKTAYYIGGPWDVDGFKSAGRNFKVVEMPTFNGQAFATPVGTQVGFVLSKSKNADAAWRFIQYVANDGAQDLYKAGNRIPAKLSEQAGDALKNNETTNAFIAQIKHGEALPTVSEMGQLWDIHSNNVKSMWAGTLSPKEAAENITAQLKEASKLIDSGK